MAQVIPGMQLQFKECSLSDIDQLIHISKKTFVDAFEKDNNPADFKSYIDFAFSKENIFKQLSHKESTFFFVLRDDFLVGYFKLNIEDAQTDIKSIDAIELERIYVLQEFQSQHIGRFMIIEAIRIASEQNKTYIWLGVWEHNTAAIRFYEKLGFSKFDTHPYYIGKDKQTDWLLRLELKKPLRL